MGAEPTGSTEPRGAREREFISVTDACALLGVSRWWMWDRIRGGVFKVYPKPTDKRVKLLRRADVERFLEHGEHGGHGGHGGDQAASAVSPRPAGPKAQAA